MTVPAETFRVANRLMTQHGVAEAQELATDRVNAMMAEEDNAGFLAWAAVRDAIAELRRHERDPGELLQ